MNNYQQKAVFVVVFIVLYLLKPVVLAAEDDFLLDEFGDLFVAAEEADNNVYDLILNLSLQTQKNSIRIYDWINDEPEVINVYQIMGTIISLPDNDRIANQIVSNTAFRVTPITSPNVQLTNKGVRIDPINIGVTATLTIIGVSGNAYNFILYSRPISESTDKFPPTFFLKINANVSETLIRKPINNSVPDYLITLKTLLPPQEDGSIIQILDVLSAVSKLNQNYQEIGRENYDHKITTFDDGVFTYFVVGERDDPAYFNKTGIPVIYTQDDSGHDQLVDFFVRPEHNLIVVKALSAGFTVQNSEEAWVVISRAEK